MDIQHWFFVAFGVFITWKVLLFLARSGAGVPLLSYTRGRFYWAYGLALLTIFSAAEFWGWGILDSDKVKDVPKNVRENPGVYRSHYRSVGRTYGGK
jgi:hypothetical protein